MSRVDIELLLPSSSDSSDSEEPLGGDDMVFEEKPPKAAEPGKNSAGVCWTLWFIKTIYCILSPHW